MPPTLVQRNVSNETFDSASQWAILGALRLFLAFVVVLGHYVRFVGTDTHHLFDSTDINARSAVWGFFVLSGFSIAASLNREASGYYRRRFLRIYPLYIAALIAGLALYAFGVVPKVFDFPLGGQFHIPTVGIVVASLLMLQTVFGTVQIVWPSWSLSIEWWHYMIAPWLHRLPNLLLIAIAASSWGLYMKLAVEPVGPAIDSIQFGWWAFACTWFWLSGFIFYRLKNDKFRVVFLMLPTLIIIVAGRFAGLPLLVSLVVLMISRDIKLRGRWVASFNWLGDLSYPLYLFHGMVLIAAVSLGAKGQLRTLVAVFAVSTAFLYAVDYPCRRLVKSRLGFVRVPQKA